MPWTEMVWAWMPSARSDHKKRGAMSVGLPTARNIQQLDSRVASTSSRAPSHAASERDTSYEKST